MAYNDQIARSDAAALVPEEIFNEVITMAQKDSVVLTKCRRVTMGRNVLRVPVASALPSASFRTGENGRASTTRAEWEKKFLNAEELVVIVPISKKVLEDSEFDIWGEVKPSLAEALGAQLDLAALFGIGKPSSWPTALVTAAHAKNHFIELGAGVDVQADINSTMGLVEADGFDCSGFAAAKNLKATLRDLRDKNNRPIYDPGTAGASATLFGEPIDYSANGGWDSTAAKLIAGDWSKAILGVRKDIEYTILTEASIYDDSGALQYALAQEGMVALMVTFRVGFEVANPVTRLNPTHDVTVGGVTTPNTRFPFAVLIPTA